MRKEFSRWFSTQGNMNKRVLYQAVSELAATARATARFLRRHALRCRTSLATPLATVVAVAVGANLDTALVWS